MQPRLQLLQQLKRKTLKRHIAISSFDSCMIALPEGLIYNSVCMFGFIKYY